MTVNIDFIPGMPPDFTSRNGPGDDSSSKTNQVLKDSMPIVHITPGYPDFRPGTANYFFMSQEFKNYHNILNKHGFSLSPTLHNGNLTLAYLADSFPTDTFANEYGENFFQSITNIASEGAASLAQVMGAKSATGMGRKGVDYLKSQKGAVLSTAGEYLDTIGKWATQLISPLAGGRAGDIIDSLMAGGRIDFPSLWKNSSYAPSYTMTIRLYNPNPASKEATEKYIIGPIAAIMLLGVPISSDSTTYSWPFLHSFHSPGIYKLDPAFISNITIVKGGDQQQIALNQSLALVDVRIDVGSLFNSMLVADKTITGRPTVFNYIETLRETKKVSPLSGHSGAQGREREDDAIRTRSNLPPSGGNTNDSGTLSDRVSERIKRLADAIINQIPGGIKIGT